MLTLTMFLTSFAWALVYVVLPFRIEELSTVGPAATLAWTGWILGITSLGAVVSGPLWSRYADRGDPKAACVWSTRSRRSGSWRRRWPAGSRDSSSLAWRWAPSDRRPPS